MNLICHLSNNLDIYDPLQREIKTADDDEEEDCQNQAISRESLLNIIKEMPEASGPKLTLPITDLIVE